MLVLLRLVLTLSSSCWCQVLAGPSGGYVAKGDWSGVARCPGVAVTAAGTTLSPYSQTPSFLDHGEGEDGFDLAPFQIPFPWLGCLMGNEIPARVNSKRSSTSPFNQHRYCWFRTSCKCQLLKEGVMIPFELTSLRLQRGPQTSVASCKLPAGSPAQFRSAGFFT